MYEQLLADKVQKSTARPDNDTGNASYGFTGVYTSDNTKTLYTSTENGTQVYYFAGNATDNWVKFGKYEKDFIVYRGYYSSGDNYNFRDYQTLNACESASSYKYNCTLYKYASAGDDIYWRIIRTNTDGGIRLLYHSTSPTATDSYIGTSAFNSTSNSPKYVGYMYGNTDATLDEARTNANDSTIKSAVDTWYENNLKTNYGKYLSTTAVYCNDRELAEGSTYKIAYNNLHNKKTLLAYLNKNDENFTLAATPEGARLIFEYVGVDRLYTNKTPTYDCANTSDEFSVSNSSAKLTYPIGLMTADEVSFAGGTYGSNAPTYYYYNGSKGSSAGEKSWWTMSPYDLYSSGSRMFIVVLSNNSVSLTKTFSSESSYGVRPVTSLKSCVKWASGDGTATNPYTIDESYEC